MMQLSKVSQINVNNPIPVYGVESKAKVSAVKPRPRVQAKKPLKIEDDVCLVAVCAYYKAEARGFEPGHEMDDWLAAEAEVRK
ncbi:MAG: DUF2934 domain-containing protein [Methylotenera sp.]